MTITEKNILDIRKYLPANVTLVCVSKFHSESTILEAYQTGERIFGESRVQELTLKQQNLPDDIRWHFIGHLQTNKIKFIINFVELIHGVDSFKLLKEIDNQAKKNNRKVKCLLQIHIAREESKFGFSDEEVREMLASAEFTQLQHIQIAGLMGMATLTEDKNQIRNEFRQLKMLFDQLKMDIFSQNESFTELSMGMSDDYTIAIEEGSTMVRVGSAIFGNRD
ncbi:MAG: YggS family pyridoxal phosphate-dependent enzyme [Paludibacteraceae bacterium]